MGSYRGEAGLRAFRAELADTLVDQDLVAGEGPFRARLSVAGIGGVGFVDADVSPVRSHRSAGDVPAGSGVFLLRARSADGVIEHRGGAEPIRPGRLVVVPAGESFAVSYRGPARLTFLAVPGAVVERRYPRFAGPIRGTTLSPFAHRLFGALRSVAPGEATTAAAVLDALLGTVAGGLVPSGPADAVRAGAARLVDEHLGDPRLGVAFLASRLGVSVRTVHRAFAEGGESAAASIRRRRLEEGARRLRDGTPVGVVAADLGFASASRFAEQFRARYGCPPSRWHERADPVARIVSPG
ncbi:helix-turn-helix domain-containing protein [Cryptosporangium arvum]|uniref:helix-turn-helix domain-containing protein n=1 Tax=Cryptosporangium arvum TaxID=80871 RepID=UPI0004BA6C05|nr:helix-turn-helix domain-containing protein [Cryptosporangium arvum]